jgi:Ca2+/Na+ antiporter
MEYFAAIFFFYLLAYLAMGFVQPITAIIRLLGAERRDSTYAIGLKRYLFSVVFYFILLIGIVNVNVNVHHRDEFLCYYLLALPWIFSIWYMRHLYIWKKKRENIIAYDTLQSIKAPHEDRLLLDSYPKKNIQLDKQLLENKIKPRDTKKTIIRKLPTLILAK